MQSCTQLVSAIICAKLHGPLLPYMSGRLRLCCACIQVLWGDFGEAPLDALAQVSMSVMLPLFSNPAVRAAWPENVAQDLTTQLHKFLSVGAPDCL